MVFLTARLAAEEPLHVVVERGAENRTNFDPDLPKSSPFPRSAAKRCQQISIKGFQLSDPPQLTHREM